MGPNSQSQPTVSSNLRLILKTPVSALNARIIVTRATTADVMHLEIDLKLTTSPFFASGFPCHNPTGFDCFAVECGSVGSRLCGSAGGGIEVHSIYKLRKMSSDAAFSSGEDGKNVR